MLKSLQQGNIAENEIIEHFKPFAVKNTDLNKKYDYDVEVDVELFSHAAVLKTDGKVTFEVKNDVMALKTGNIAIEHHNSKQDKPSGISVTKAHFWAHKIGDDVWICTVEKLKEFVNKEKPFKTIKSGGDKNANLYIYKIEQFTPICVKLSSIKHIHDLLDML